jgi:uncharacterized protein
MRHWRLSEFTIAIEESCKSTLLYNSFMGALARLDRETAEKLASLLPGPMGKFRTGPFPAVADAIVQQDRHLAELARGGFLVPDDCDERAAVAELLEKERNYAFHLILLPHEDCNFRCTYCYESFARGKMQPHIVEALEQLVKAKAREFRIINVGWFGGEPCLALDIIERLSRSFQAACAATDARYLSSMTTNGYFLSRRNVEMLLKGGVRHFQVTLDGKPEDHDRVRHLRGGQPTFRRIAANLVGMTGIEGEFSVAVRVNFSQASLPSMPDFVSELAEKLTGDARFFLDFHAMGKWGGPHDAVLPVVDAGGAHRARIALNAMAACKGFPPAAFRDALQPHGSVCYAGKETSMVIGSDGRIYKCTVAFEDPRNHVGWLRRGGLVEIDHDKWQRWVKPSSQSGKCGACAFSASCQSRACPLAAMDEGEPPCPYTEDELGDIIRLAAGPTSAVPGRDRRRYVSDEEVMAAT